MKCTYGLNSIKLRGATLGFLRDFAGTLRARSLRLSNWVLLSHDIFCFDRVHSSIKSVSHCSSLGLSVVGLELLLTIDFVIFPSVSGRHDFVESTVVTSAASFASLMSPGSLVPVARLDIGLMEKSIFTAVNEVIDFAGNGLDALLSKVSVLEGILRSFFVRHISEEVVVIFGPEFLSLLEKQPRLDLRVFLLGMLQSPPLFAAHLLGEFREFTTMDANSDITELGRVVGNHIGASLLI